MLCIETFEHVFEVRRAFDEVFRILKPGGLFVITSPLNFRIHGYPDDYWRMTPNCLRRMLEPYAAAADGLPGLSQVPALGDGPGVKAPAPADFAARADALVAAYRRLARARPRPALPLGAEAPPGLRPALPLEGRAVPGRRLLPADFTLDVGPPLGPGGLIARRDPRHDPTPSRGRADGDDARPTAHPGPRRRDLDGARPDAPAAG